MATACMFKGTRNGITGPMDGYTDWAADFQCDRTIPRFKNDVLSVRGSYIRENSSLLATFAAGGAAQTAHHLNTAQANVEHHFGTKLSGTAGLFDITGTRDSLLFSQAAVPRTKSLREDDRTLGTGGPHTLTIFPHPEREQHPAPA